MNIAERTHKLTPIRDRDKIHAVLDAISNYDIPSSEAWAELVPLSSNTQFDGLDALSEGLFQHSGSDFEAVGTVSVILNYGGEDEASSMSESFPAHMTGYYDGEKKRAQVEALNVDTSSFEQ